MAEAAGLLLAGLAGRMMPAGGVPALAGWRTDEVTALAPHPHDPGLPQAAAGAGQAEFLTTFTRAVPPGTPDEAVRDADAGEAERAAELGRQGHLLRLWQVPSQGNSLGQWRAADPAEMQALLKTLPLDPYLTVDTTPLTPHPSDPAAAG